MRAAHEITHDQMEQTRSSANGITKPHDIGGCGCPVCARARQLRAARPSEPAGESDRAKIAALTPAQRSALLASLEREHEKVPARPVLTSNVDPDAGMTRGWFEIGVALVLWGAALGLVIYGMTKVL